MLKTKDFFNLANQNYFNPKNINYFRFSSGVKSFVYLVVILISLKMKILIVAATRQEIKPLLDKMEFHENIEANFIKCRIKHLEIDFLIAGIGMVATTYHAGKKLNNNNYNLALNIGICGSFNDKLELGAVVNIVQDHFSDLGAEDGNQYLSIKEMGLEGDIEMINNTHIKNNVLNLIPKVSGITVNTAHGNELSIKKVIQKFNPNTESMEGAAFMFVCENEGVAYAQIRGVSNYMERRNKLAWEMKLAINNLNIKILEILNAFE